MIKIENVEVYGFEAAIRGMRNPLNSWDRSDSFKGKKCISEKQCTSYGCSACIGENDHDLMMRLAKAGSVHAKYRRMITVTCDIVAPLYWYKEYDTYKVGTVANSTSTMHKIHAKKFTMGDFSHEHLITHDTKNRAEIFTVEGYAGYSPTDIMEYILIPVLNKFRSLYLDTKDKRYWWQMIQLLPSSYNQRRTVQLNYEVLSAMYRDRKDHKLDEWRDFCKWIETLPYSEVITL